MTDRDIGRATQGGETKAVGETMLRAEGGGVRRRDERWRDERRRDERRHDERPRDERRLGDDGREVVLAWFVPRGFVAESVSRLRLPIPSHATSNHFHRHLLTAQPAATSGA